ncbi:MAG: glycosyltransferase family 2 protein [Oligosphaeraceae bacterium]
MSPSPATSTIPWNPRGIYVVIPCYREDPAVVERTVRPLVEQGYSVVLVDDGSPVPLALPGLPVTILRHEINRGQGAALQTGGDYAREQGAQAVVHFDADGQHEAAAIPRAWRLQQESGAQVILGSRFLRQEDLQAIPRGRRTLLKLARGVNGILTGLWLTDAHNGFRLLTPQALEAIRLQEDRMAHATEILLQIRRKNLAFRELPVHVTYPEYARQKGQRAWAALEILTDLFWERWL